MATELFHFEQFESFSPYTVAGPYRAADYWKLPEGEPVELVRGRLIVSPSPNALHQIVLRRLSQIFESAEEDGGGLCFFAPMDVVLSDDTILQPDMLYIARDRRSIVGDRIEGVPDLVVEILSPGSDRRDRTEKLDLYAKYGVSEYWMVNPDSRHFEFLTLDKNRYVVTQPVDDRYQSPLLPEVEIDLAAFWQAIDRRL
jgi:Uma2 family endonuclease